MASKYAPEDKQRIMERYIETGGNAKRTARELDVPRSTVRAIASGEAMVVATMTDDDVQLWGTAARAVAKRIAERAPLEEDLQALSAAARATVGAHLDYRDGRKGAVQNNLHLGDNNTIVASDDAIAAVIAARGHVNQA